MNNNKNHIIHKIILLIVGILLLSSCAQIVSPGGGAKDILPPKTSKYIPDSAQLNFNSRIIEITFDEYIQLKDLNNQLIISPLLAKTPDITVKGKTLIIELDKEETLKPNTTLFIQYRVGGGLATNLGVNVINQVGNVSFFVNGPSESTNTSVVNSLSCNNVTAAIGGAGLPTLEEIRNFVSFNFAAQNRAVTISDYEALIRKMPGQFGAPAKVAIVEEDNKIKIKTLSYDTSGALTSIVSNTLLTNLAEYLSNYRMLNDYISVETAQVIDLAVEVSIVLDASQNQGAVIGSVINKITDYFNPSVRQLGQNVNVSEINKIIQSENGVLSLTDLKVFNQVGGQYSSSETSQSYSDSATKQIGLIDNTIFALPTQIYQIRYPNKDITVKVKNFQTVSIS